MRKLTPIVLALALVLGSCGGGGDQVEAAETTITAAEPTTSITAEMPTRTSSPETRLVTDLVYHASDDRFSTRSGLTDVIAPTEGGPWPTVVATTPSARPGWTRTGSRCFEITAMKFSPSNGGQR